MKIESMNTFIKRSLQIGAGFNFFAALSVSFPDSIGKPLEMPPVGSVFFSYLLGLLVALFGGVYWILSKESPPNRSLVALASFGKLCVFLLAFYCWTIAAIPTKGFAVAFGDLIFAGLFGYWLLKTKPA